MKVTFINRPQGEGCFSFEELFSTIKRSFPNGISVSDYYMDPEKSFFQNIISARKLDADLFHVTGGIYYFGIFLNKHKTLLTIHDVGHYTDGLKGLKKFIYGLLWFHLPIWRAVFVTTVSEETKKELLKCFHVPPEKIVVIPNCYSESFAYAPKIFCAEKPRILQVGTPWYKNVGRLAEALKGLNCRLVLIGSLSPEILDTLEKNKIEYENYRDLTHEEVYRQYVLADLVTFISLKEGFGLPIIEGNAVGTPVVTSNLSSMPEVAGDAACLVDPYDVADIRRGIEKVIVDEEYRELLIRNGLENIKRFDPRNVAARYFDLYENILTGKIPRDSF